MNKMQTYNDMTNAELQGELVSLKKELFNLRFQLASGQAQNTSRIPQVKKSIARVMTVVKRRDLGLEKSIESAPAVKVDTKKTTNKVTKLDAKIDENNDAAKVEVNNGTSN